MHTSMEYEATKLIRDARRNDGTENPYSDRRFDRARRYMEGGGTAEGCRCRLGWIFA